MTQAPAKPRKQRIVGLPWRIMAKPFGYPMYAAPVGGDWSDNASEAYVYDDRDNPAMKLAFWRVLLKRQGIDASAVQIEMV